MCVREGDNVTLMDNKGPRLLCELQITFSRYLTVVTIHAGVNHRLLAAKWECSLSELLQCGCNAFSGKCLFAVIV